MENKTETKEKFSWTPEQLEAISDRGNNLLVSASAGSGKTTVMIQRIVDLMLENKIPISKFLVVTFTKASASDMKKKLVDKLLKCNEDSFAVSQVENVEVSDISNLHSFCSRLISTYFYEAEVDPSYHVIDDNESAHLKDKALTKLFEQKEQDGNVDFFELFDIFQKKRKDKVLKEIIVRFNDFLNSHIDGSAWFNQTLEDAYNLDLSQNSCAKIINNYVANLAKNYAEKCEKYANKYLSLGAEKLYSHFMDISSNLRSIKLGNSYMANAKNVFDMTFDRTPTLSDEFKYLSEEVKLVKEEIKDQVDNFKENFISADEDTIIQGLKITKARIMALYELTVQFDKIYSELKKEINGLDFNDLEKYTLKILSNEAILSAVKQKYEYVFVDEYQDINNVQEAIISLVSGKNNRFMVGDIKQSIYRFRLCDPDIFLSKYEQYQQPNNSSKLIKLNANFRSDKKILKFVDKVFAGVMTDDFGGVNYQKDAMFIAGENNLDKPCSMNLCYIDTYIEKSEKPEANGVYSVKNHTQEETAEVKNAIAEAKLVASKISDLVNVQNPDAIKYSDIAVLVGARNDATAKFVETLEGFGIPVVSDEKHNLMEKPYIMEIVNYIKFIVNPKDDFLLFNVLKSRLFDFSDADLVEIRKVNHKIRFFECINQHENIENCALKSKIIEFKQKSGVFARLAKLVSVKELASKIIQEFSLEKVNLLSEDGEQINEELSIFVDALPNVEAAEFVLEFNEFALEYENEAAGNRVKLMTIHKSKGIEFKAVFLINTANGFNFKSTYKNILFNKNYGVGMDYFDGLHRTQMGTVAISAIRLIERRKLVEEQQRVLYVALTRAIEKLYVICCKPCEKLNEEFTQRPTAYINWFEPKIVQELAGNADDELNFEVYKLSDLLQVSKMQNRQLLLKKSEQMAPDWFEYKYKNYTQIALKNSVSKLLNKVVDSDEYEDAVFENASAISSMQRGTVYHKVLQNIDLKNLNDLDLQLKKLSESFDEYEWDLIDTKIIKNVLKQPIFAEIKQDDIILQEREYYASLPVSRLIKHTDDNTTEDAFIMQGVIDLVIAKPSELWVLDYKTGQINDEKLEKYKFQLDIYAEVAEKSFNRPVTKKLICLIDSQKILEF